ncbi:hypothetical protein I79_000893 [Cricetulus griseus]|uniref:Uncharacterized protein n=1 Tax=Cricetulus griseus TaxID=10029 RepID=G3GTB6_CRIGR|nr:hypothetical protein I79_000893 [Cricetulus griseus]
MDGIIPWRRRQLFKTTPSQNRNEAFDWNKNTSSVKTEEKAGIDRGSHVQPVHHPMAMQECALAEHRTFYFTQIHKVPTACAGNITVFGNNFPCSRVYVHFSILH